MNPIDLKRYGLNDQLVHQATQYPGMILARVSAQHHQLYQVISEQGEFKASVSGKLLYAAHETMDFPAVGDWVMVDQLDVHARNAIIRHILERTSVLARKAAGTSNATQIVAANIDTIFICMSLNEDFNLRRLERYLSVAWDSMATPVIVLTKADLCDHLQQKLVEIESVSVGTNVIVCSSLEEKGCESIQSCTVEGKTIAFIGSSGVGKSTLINRLLGEDVLLTKEIRQDDGRGRHATTHRQLLLLPGGGVVIDTPGMRELQIFTGNLEKAFEDIEALARVCKYNDCTHTTEPGCAIKKAIQAGQVSAERFENYLKLQKEMGYEGLNSRQLEQEKINRMFGSKGEMKRAHRYAKEKNNR